jgi:hypothetical protein
MVAAVANILQHGRSLRIVNHGPEWESEYKKGYREGRKDAIAYLIPPCFITIIVALAHGVFFLAIAAAVVLVIVIIASR